jgi:hypothetical protein
MARELQWLVFDASESDDGGCTLEAMASVSPDRLPDVLTEAALVLAWLHQQAPGGPRPLDEGGDWDVLLQMQADVSLLQDVTWDAHTGQLTPPPFAPDARWLALTLTLVLSEALQGPFEAEFIS